MIKHASRGIQPGFETRGRCRHKFKTGTSGQTKETDLVFPFLKLIRFCQITSVLKIAVVPKEATFSFLSDYLWLFTIGGKLCKVALVVIFSFGYLDKFEFTSKGKKLKCVLKFIKYKSK